jgi:conserved oligomeric Golgi complex subunit 4
MSITPLASPPAPASPTDTSTSSPQLDFGSPDALAQIRAITDVGTLNRLLHECIAFQRSLDLSLESLLSRRPDLDRQLTSLLRSSPPLLDLAISEASNLLTSAESSASLASSLSSHVRHLDLAQSQVDSTLSRVLASLDRSRALESARRALASDSPDLESAAQAVYSFLQIDLKYPSEEDELRRDMFNLKRRLESLIRRNLTTAIDSRDHLSVLRLIRLFPLLSLSKEGLQTFVSYLKKVVSVRARLDFEHLCELADSSDKPDFVGCLTALFKDIVLAIEQNDGVLRELSGEEGVAFAVCELQEECDLRGTQIMKKYTDYRKLIRLAADINSYSKNNLLSVTTVMATAVQQSGPDPREIETYLEEILALTQLGEDYAEFMVSKIRGLSGSDTGSKGIKAVKFGNFSKMVQDLTGFYVIFEEFFMVENVRKAVRIDEIVPDALATSMVDDVFFVLQSCCRYSHIGM